MLTGHVSPDGIVPGECPWAVGAADPDALVALPDVGPQVGLVTVGPLAVGAFHFSTYKFQLYFNMNHQVSFQVLKLVLPKGWWHK